MDKRDWEAAFRSITDKEDPVRDDILLWELNRALAGINEASAYLSRFICQFIQNPHIENQGELEETLAEMIATSDEWASSFNMCDCPECNVEIEDCDCEDEETCDCWEEIIDDGENT
jgi:hypothetical protein